MIGTHDSYTFLPARKKLFEWFSFLWRTQVKSIAQQKEIGVTYFDVRVRRDGNVWRVCHGLVDFDLTFKSIGEIVNIFSVYKVRIILEREGSEDLFREEVLESIPLPSSFFCLYKEWMEGLYLIETLRIFVLYLLLLRLVQEVSFWVQYQEV